MKKKILKAIVVGFAFVSLVACSKNESANTSKTVEKEASSETRKVVEKSSASSSEKKIEMKDVDFQVEGTNYKMKILDNWKVLEDEEFSFSAENENSAESVMVSGVKKTDVDDFTVLKSTMKEEMKSDNDVQIEEETIKEEPCQTSHYAGELYSFIAITDGAKVEFRFYFLETETEYIILNFTGLPSFFERNGEQVIEIVDSFVAG